MPYTPISAELWQRLRRLDARCHVSAWRADEWLVQGQGGRTLWSGVGGPPSPHRRVWRVRLYPRDSSAIRDIIDTAEPEFAEAISAAVEEAERRGWTRH